MSGLIVPDSYNRQGQLDFPLGDVNLASGLKLRFKGLLPVDELETVGLMALYERDGLRVMASMDHTPRWGPLLHVSLSHRGSDPTWVEIRQVKDAFFGDQVDAMMVLPRAEDYVNHHPHTFHLWQCPEGWRLM